MRWLIRTRRPAAAPLAFCRSFSRGYDLFHLASIRLERGEKPYGVYGWLDYSENSSGWDKYIMTLHIPGPFPYKISIREPDSALERRDIVVSKRGIKFSVRHLRDRSEGLVWLFGHEFFHYLSSTKQVDSENNEYNADSFANSVLDKYREK